MGFISSIGKSIGNAVSGAMKSLASNALSSVTSGLKSLTDGFVDMGKEALKGAVKNILPKPLQALAGMFGLDKLIDKGIDALGDGVKNLAGQALDAGSQYIQNAINNPSPVTLENGLTTTLPAFAERAPVQQSVPAPSASAPSPTSVPNTSDKINAPGTIASTLGEQGAIKDADWQLMKKQEEMQNYNRTITMLTNMLQMDHEAKKAIASNFRA